MRIAEYDRFGDASVLGVRERPEPATKPGHVLVRVRAAALNPKDVLTRAGKYALMSGRSFPKHVGYDWAGEAVAVGRDVRGVKEGDALYGMIQAWAGGACAEYVLARADELAPKPAGLSFAEAAALPLVSLTALQALRDEGRLGVGMRVMVHGASGGVGVHAVQIAKALGAHVTTVTSARNEELVRSLGADETLAYDRGEQGTPSGYDVFFDVFGNRPFRKAKGLLAPRGTHVTTVPKPANLLSWGSTLFTFPRARIVVVRSRTRDLETISGMVASGALRPVVDRVMPLEAIAEAERYIETKRARGKVVLSIDRASIS